MLKGIKKNHKSFPLKQTCRNRGDILRGKPRSTVQGWRAFYRAEHTASRALTTCPTPYPKDGPRPGKQEMEGRKGTSWAQQTPNLSSTGQKAKSRIFDITSSEKAPALRQTMGKCQSPSKIRHLISHIRVTRTKEITLGASLVAQWLRIQLPMQGTRVRALVREDPTCCGATKPMCHNY